MKGIKMRKKEILEFLKANSAAIGFGGWDIVIKRVKTVDNGDLARIEIGDYLKELTLELPDIFLKLPEKKQRNTLIHELVHGRVLLSQLKTRNNIEYEEEMLVNDITTMMELIK